ncbi:hypothetical protein HU200_017923 [Digitaria exilis]|uniref:Desiccation-related protein PCC13-62 n=1 Tax=Digitaria exilis TaxID=1010633 RepID=A0A835F503_9POAL|nr:hypothetical protein HU200_017923 [Digitaria exilis]
MGGLETPHEALPPVGDPADTTCPAEQPSPAVAPMPSNHSEPGCQPPPPRIPTRCAEFFLHAAYGKGLDQIAPNMKANLDDLTWRIVAEFALQEVGHIRFDISAIQDTVGGFPRPSIDLSAHNFARVMDLAFGSPLNPPFDPYINSLNFLLASYFIPYLGINGYVGTNPIIDGYKTKMLVAGLLGVEAGQDAVIRALLFERRGLVVAPYNVTVAEFTDRVSALRNKLGQAHARTPAQLLEILYLSGDERVPGGFFPEGANGRIARSFLGKPDLGADEAPLPSREADSSVRTHVVAPRELPRPSPSRWPGGQWPTHARVSILAICPKPRAIILRH